MSGKLGAVRIESISEASSAPFESRFAPCTVSTFTTNFVIVTVDKCYVKIAHITLKLRRFRLFGGRRIEIQPPTVEVDRIDEVLFIPESAGGVLHPLDLRIERFTGSIGNLMSQISDDVFESPLQHRRFFFHRC